MARVTHQDVLSERGSELALDAIRLEPGTALELRDDLHDSLLLVHEGDGLVRDSLGDHAVAAVASVLVPAGESAVLTAGAGVLKAVRATVGAATDLHAPIGTRSTVVALDHVEPGTATGARSFQVLHGPHNGSTRATAFVGYIPPGRAPWHYHLYDEIVCVLAGAGRLHLGAEPEPLKPGSAFRLSPREVHIVENTGVDEPLSVLGLFTPAGSPSAAYLPGGVARYAEP
jgi:quercetin dioxygenase-like cupin family protein